jgi:uncharacterized protein YndB with AHSA1/START domain
MSKPLVTTRVFDTPAADLYAAFSDPSRLARWWGPAGFENSFETFELRPGGTWLLAMTGPDGSVFRLRKLFMEVDPARVVVLDHIDPVHGFRMRMDYEPLEGDRTRLTWTVTFTSPEEAERVREAFLAANEQNLDRLEAEIRS